MRPKNKLRDAIDYSEVFREPINRLHKKWDAKHGSEVVEGCCMYSLRILIHPDVYVHPHYGSLNQNHRMFVEWYWKFPDMFLDVLTTLRREWFNPSAIFKAQDFILGHRYLTTDKGELLPIENATDGEISQVMDRDLKIKISLATVKKARQLLSKAMSPRGKQLRENSL
jgi:hypothetical protein